MLTNVLGFLAEYFHRYLLYFHFIKYHKSKSISKKGVTIIKDFKFVIVKVKKWLFFLQNLIFMVSILGLSSTITIYSCCMKNCDPFFCPKFCFEILRCQLRISKQRSVLTFLRTLPKPCIRRKLKVEKYIHTHKSKKWFS